MNLIDKYADEVREISSGFEKYCDELTVTQSGFGTEFTVGRYEFVVIKNTGGFKVTKWRSRTLSCKTEQLGSPAEVNAFLRKETGK